MSLTRRSVNLCEYGPCFRIGQLSSPLFSFVRSLLHFVSSPVAYSNRFVRSNVSFVLPSFILFVNEETTFSCAHFIFFISWWLFLHYYPFWAKRGVSEQDGGWVFLTNWLTYSNSKPFWLLDWNHSIRAMVSKWPEFNRAVYQTGWNFCTFPFRIQLSGPNLNDTKHV